MKAIDPNLRFREAREHLGISQEELATRSGVIDADVWEIEALDGDLTRCYSPKQVQQFCRVLGIRPVELFGDELAEPLISAGEVVRLVHEECRMRDITLDQFADLVELHLKESIEPPEKILENLTVDDLRCLCHELRIDWRRAL